ncbi:MAG: helix-turn-helix transcriptional regulator [Sinobacteraceae bacterium]|nr:helix-turn-helix transcriptional regulator [Nevskiaceae bacterium]
MSYSFGVKEQRGAALDNPLFELLAAVAEAGSIRHAAQLLGASYRYVWGSLRKWERTLGSPLMTWSQGQRARLTEFAERLLWTERSVRVRMQPHLEALRSDLAGIVVEAHDATQQLLRIAASHDLALPILQQHLAQEAQLHLDISFRGSAAALRALNQQHCVLAGFHVPVAQTPANAYARTLQPLLHPREHALIPCARRLQGLMVRKEHAAAVRKLADVAALQLRFVNRQPGSGTRLLIEHLLQSAGIAPVALQGFDRHVEQSHIAVALCVASGVADAGIGVQAAALQYGLQFVPILQEHYFLACHVAVATRPAVSRLCAVVAGPRWGQILANLPGYEPASAAGAILPVAEVLPWWPR